MAAIPLAHAPRRSRSAGHAGEARARARAARRVALLEIAEQVFAERGFAGATMAEIASRAGYSAGNLYNVFEGKDALFEEILVSRGDEVLGLARRAIRSGSNLGEIVDAYVDATLDLVEKYRGFFVLLSQAAPDFDWHGQPSNPKAVHLRKQLVDDLDRLFRGAMERGELPRGNPRPYAVLLHGTLTAHISHWVRHGGDRDELWESASDLRRLLRQAMGVPTGPSA
jgi:AcrR family transcriptional regulator